MTHLYIYHNKQRVPTLCRRWRRRFNGTLINELSMPKFKRGDVILNYGCSIMPLWAERVDAYGLHLINHWLAIKYCANKMITLDKLSMERISTLNYTIDSDVASKWDRTVVRHKLMGTRGEDIEIINKSDKVEMPDAPLYTEYYRKTHEFRVHVFMGKVIDYTQKKRLTKEELDKRDITRNKYVRTHATGWVFCREGVQYNEKIESLALRAAECVGIDYCGVDILANFSKETGEYQHAVVCEINSAPGMVKTTYLNYVKAIRKLL